MVGQIAETEQVMATQFRAGNVPPTSDNPGFIRRCERALSETVLVSCIVTQLSEFAKATGLVTQTQILASPNSEIAEIPPQFESCAFYFPTWEIRVFLFEADFRFAKNAVCSEIRLPVHQFGRFPVVLNLGHWGSYAGIFGNEVENELQTDFQRFSRGKNNSSLSDRNSESML